ncbi:stage VI sporulation protein D [Bacillus sp. Root239]|nr:stage VI sporulation protein D [Bacillus sp. Root239]
MSQDNLSCLRFSVEESVWFQKGQEVSQLLSISLEPQVSIQEYDQYVSIRGALQLTGEYETYEGEHSLREYTNENQVQSISVREDGTAELSHQFPVDITIPKNRIQSIEDVYVSIDLFDYELPGTNQLQLMADLSITGLYGEQHEEREEEEEFSEEQHIVSYEEVDDAEEVYTENVAQEEEQEEQELDVSYREAPALLEAEAIEEEHSEGHSEEHSEETPSYFSSVFKKESRAEPVVEYEEEAYEPFEVEVKKEAQIEEEREDNVIELFQLRQEQESFEESQASELNTYADVQREAEQEEAEQEEAEQEEEKIIVEFRKEENESSRNENALYLTKLFSREEEAFSTWKLCIVQDGDSLDTIANRYNTNVQNILRVNNLEDEYELEEGSILNIPVR